MDFDNTIVKYDRLLQDIARDWGLGCGEGRQSKTAIRDFVRSLQDGERTWQRLQACAYGERILEAPPAEGVAEFFRRCHDEGVPVRVVSHKTIVPNLPGSHLDLRTAAVEWLAHHGFLRSPEFGLSKSAVFFESTRSEKVTRIAQLGVTHFIDDLEETFQEPGFPAGVAKILYSSEAPPRDDVTVLETWHEISDHLFRVVAAQ